MNAEEAARIIGCNSRTVLRHIAKGTITATHRHAQELEITQDQVEILRKVLAPSEKSGQSDDMSRQMEELTLRVKTLEEKVRTLESGHVTTKLEPPVSLPSYNLPTRKIEPQNRFSDENRAIPDEIPEGSLLMAEFAAQHGVNRATMWRHCTSGIQGDRIETIERPKPGGRAGDVERWLSPELQEEARAFWRRHNVKFTL